MSVRPRKCRRCRRTDDVCGVVSKRGLCAECGAIVMIDAARSQAAKEGPAYEAWLRGRAAAAQRTVAAMMAASEEPAP